MVNYQLGKIYKLHCNVTTKDYYGSTCLSLQERLSSHVSKHRRFVNGKVGTENYCRAFLILDNNNYTITLVENFPCDSKDELETRERYFIENHDCVNKQHPTRGKDKEFKKKYMEEYRIINKEKLNDQSLDYYYAHKDKINEQSNDYKLKNKDKLETKILCECGSMVQYRFKNAHKKSLKHQKWEENQN